MVRGRCLAAVLTIAITLTCMPVQAMAASQTAEWLTGGVKLASTVSRGEKLSDTYYFTDDWFNEDAATRNDSLALVSMQLTANAAADTLDSAAKPGASFLKKLGFTETGFYSGKRTEGFNYTWGIKTVGSGSRKFTLIAVDIQSYDPDKENKARLWQQNFTANGPGAQGASGEHYSFRQAALNMLDDVAALSAEHRTAGTEVKYWITGQSRGGALANLLAAHLPAGTGIAGSDIFAYTFESPMTADSNAIAVTAEENYAALTAAGAADGSIASDEDQFAYIHNYVCSDDLVTMLPMWGMTLYGVRHQLKTNDTDAHLREELANLGSKGANGPFAPETKQSPEQIVAKLAGTIRTRADYSSQQTDSFTFLKKDVSVSYVYQDALSKLVYQVLANDLADKLVNSLVNFNTLPALKLAVDALADGIEKGVNTSDGMKKIWEAEQLLAKVLQSENIDTGLTDGELYALLKLAGPIVINPKGILVSDKLAPGKDLYENRASLAVSHQYDTVIARLKTLAPLPQVKSVEFKAAKKQIKATWTKNSKASGYQILIAKNKNMKNARQIKVGKNKNQYTIRKLKSGKTYYVAIRPVTKTGGVSRPGILSKVKKVKVK